MESSFDIHALSNKIKNKANDKLIDIISNHLIEGGYIILDSSSDCIRCRRESDSAESINFVLNNSADELINNYGDDLLDCDLEYLKCNLFFPIPINDNFYEIRF